MNIFKSRLKLVKGTRFISFLFISSSILIAAGILFAVNMYYNIDTQEVVVEQVQRVTGILRATAGAIVGGGTSQNPRNGYAFEVVGQTRLATTTIAPGQPLRFYDADESAYVGFKAPTEATTSEYTWPAYYPSASGQVLQSTIDGALSWLDLGQAGLGDILAVGDCPSGECFTSGGTSGTSLWFYDAQGRGKLTIADLTAARTYTLPDVSGTIALGTSTANYVAYWTGTNTLGGEAQLSTSRGGTGANSSAWSGMVRVVSGSWSPVTGTAGYAAYWFDANTVAAEQYLALSRGGTGAGLTAAAGGIVYSGASALAISAVGTANQVLTSGGAAAPSWQNIADLITATNGLTESGTTQLTLKLGGALTETTTITQGTYDMIFNLTGAGDFKVQDNGTDILTVTDDGRILFKTYPLAESGKQILREMIPIMGFDLPVQTATTSYVKISKTLENYPFATPSTGSTRVHKLVFRYAASTTADIEWRVSTTTGQTYFSSTIPAPTSNNLEQGNAYVATTTIPEDGTDWWLEIKTATVPDVVRVFQIFLAAYDQIQ